MINNKSEIDRQGVHKCGLIFEKLGFIFREQTVCDYGIDAIIEEKGDNYPLGKLIGVQIKSGDSYFDEIKNGNVVFRGDIKHYNYWLNHSLPVIIVLYCPSKDQCIWEVINKQTAKKCGAGWKIDIPWSHILENSKLILQSLVNKQSEYERRWNSLVVAKEWMLETVEHGESILEVEEWINKSSGRGKFILKVQKNEKEKILYEREWFGFGIKKYEQVIQELFPWADIKIDEEFYEENMEEDYYEFLKDNDNISRIYPYRNGAGEVDFYRLKLTLNQIGKSFIEMENFLEKGKCYFIDNSIL